MKLNTYYSMVDFMEAEKQFVNTDTEVGSIVLIQRPEVIYVSDECCDVDYCRNNNIIHTQETYMYASCVVMDKGNIILTIKRCNIDGKSLRSVFANAFIDYLKSKGLDAKSDGNDILVDGYKVASGVESEFKNGHRYMGYQISLVQNMDLISKVCKKPMIKVPKGLADFGLTTDDIIEFCNEFWKKY